MAESTPSLEIIEIQKSESALWNRFVTNSPQGTIFHTTLWADIISRTFSRSYKIIHCLKNEQLVGGMIFFTHKKLLWRMITPTAFFPFCAPIFYLPVAEKPQKTIHNHLNITYRIEEYLRDNYDYWILDMPASSKDVRSYLWKGASVEPRYTYVVSLKKKEDIYNNFNQNIRKKLKQAENQETASALSNELALYKLENSYLGIIGHASEPFFAPLGYDWRMAVALETGLAAKEVVVATLGVLYGLGVDEDEQSSGLVDKIRANISLPAGISFIVFVMIYLPCLAASLVFMREAGSWKYLAYLFVFTTVTAWSLSFIAFNIAQALT